MTHPTSSNDNSSANDDLALLIKVSQLLGVVDLDEVLQEVIDLAATAVDATKTSFFLHEEAGVDWEHLVTMRDLSPEQSITVVERVLDEGFAGWVYKHQRGDIIHDTTEDDRWITFDDDSMLARSALCVPFIYEAEVIATITHVHEEPNHFTPHHLRLVTIIANQAAIAIRNAQLFYNLQQQRSQLSTVLQSINDVLLVVDEERKLIMVNDAAMDLMDIDPQEDIVGKPLAEFTMVDDVFEPLVDILSDGIIEKQRSSFEARSERRQTDYRVTVGTWHNDERDGDRGWVIVMHNVTELHDLSRFKAEMLKVASYDLREPLALISGYADMVGMDTADPTSPVHNYVKVIKRAVEQMGRLVEDLLRVERIRNEPLELQKETDLAALVKLVIVNMRPQAEGKEIQFETELDLDGIPRIAADAVLLRQAMENLIDNAVKFTPSGERVTVRAYYDDSRFHFSVEDTGIGIPEDEQGAIFKSFHRVGDDESRGSGLGLSLVRNVIARHHGEVWVRSTVGKGSRFGFWLPLLGNHSGATPPPDNHNNVVTP